MKVKIGNEIFDSEVQPIMVILSEEEKSHIANMATGATKYCSAPESMKPELVEQFMQTNKEPI